MYEIRLTPGELRALGWATDRGYFPEETFRALSQAPTQPRVGDGAVLFLLPEHAAWPILEAREDDPHALYACLGGELLRKLIELESKIV